MQYCIILDDVIMVDNNLEYVEENMRIEEMLSYIKLYINKCWEWNGNNTYPDIMDGKRFNLGTLVMDRLWNFDKPNVMKVIENLISYALIRDEHREFVKDNR